MITMITRLRLYFTHRFMAWTGVAGLGLLPCFDCGVPLAVYIWPVAAVVAGWRLLRRRSERQLDLLLTGELQSSTASPVAPAFPHDHGTE